MIPFKSHPPLSTLPIKFSGYSRNSPKRLALHSEIMEMMGKGAIEVAPLQTPGFYRRMFVVSKASGGFRPVIDLSQLNLHIQQTPFKMDTVRSVLLAIRRGDWFVSLDLKDAYFQIPVHADSRRFLRFVWEGVVYQFTVLCFGLCTAPQVFTRMMALVSGVMHGRGFRMLRYLDDWLVLASSLEGICKARDCLLELCRILSITINLPKSSLTPAQSIQYLGMSIDSVSIESFSCSEPRCAPRGGRSQVLESGSPSCKSLAGSVRAPGIFMPSGSGRQAAITQHSVATQTLLEPSSYVASVPGEDSSPKPSGLALVDSRRECFGGSVVDYPGSSTTSLHRRLLGRVGGVTFGPACRGALVRDGISRTYKPFRAKGGSPSSGTFSGRSTRGVRGSVGGQYHGSSLSKVPRRHEIRVPNAGSSVDSLVGGTVSCDTRPPLHSGQK